jgi:cysteine dioxygenase
MTCETATTTLSDLIVFLDGLSGRVPLDELLEHLEQLDIDPGELAEYVRFSEQGYTRNLVRSGPWYELLVLCWTNGQCSPIHDHAGSSCGVRVLRGVLTETSFAFDPEGRFDAVGSRDLAAGTVCGSQDGDLHQVANLQDNDADLVTLHVYSPPLRSTGLSTCTSPAIAVSGTPSAIRKKVGASFQRFSA